MSKEITSLKNPIIKDLKRLRDHPGDSFLVEGFKMAREAVLCGAAEELLISRDASEDVTSFCANSAVPVITVTDAVIESLSSARSPQKIVCRCTRDHPFPAPRFPHLTVALNHVQDPGNVGTILRTLDAAGGGLLYTDPGCANPYASKALSASMGSIFRVRVQPVDDLPSLLLKLSGSGITSIAGDLQGEDFFRHTPFGDKTCVVIGNEGHGIDEAVRQSVTKRCKLPIPGYAESLNAAVSAGVFLYGILRDILPEGGQS